MVKVKLIKDCIYHVPSHVFDYRAEHTKTQKVSNKLGQILLNSGYFEEIKDETAGADEEQTNGEECKSCICTKCSNLKLCSESICKSCKHGKDNGTFDQCKQACDNFKEKEG